MTHPKPPISAFFFLIFFFFLKYSTKKEIAEIIPRLLQSEYIFLEQVLYPRYAPEMVNYSMATGTAQN